MIRIALVVVIALGLATVTSLRPVHADGPSKAERKKAKKLILGAGRDKRQGDKLSKRKGKRNHNKAQAAYRKAALAYIEAYSLVEAAALVYKLAEIYQARGEYKWARRGYRRYLEMAPDGDDSADANARLEKLAALIAAHEESGKPWPEDEDTELDPTAVFGFEKPEKAEEPDEPEEPEQPEEPDEPEPEPVEVTKKAPSGAAPGKWLKWGGIGSAGVGAVCLGVGIGFGARAASAADSLSSNDDQWNINDRNLITRGESDNDKMILFTTVGVVGLVAGGALYYLGMRADSKATETQISVVPTTGGGMTGVVVGGSF